MGADRWQEAGGEECEYARFPEEAEEGLEDDLSQYQYEQESMAAEGSAI